MKKSELITKVSSKLEITKTEVEKILGYIDTIVEVVAEEGSKTKVGTYFTVEKAHVEEKSGVCAGKEFTKEAHEEILIKRTSICKNI